MAACCGRPSRETILRYTALVIGCLLKFISGSLFSFNVYANSLKKTFNLTQSEVELCSSLLALGLAFGVPAGLLHDNFGPRCTSLVAVITSTGGFLLLWGAVGMKEFYHNHSTLLAFYFFIAGHGSVYTYISALATNLKNFRECHYTKVVALLDACFGSSPIVFAAIYAAFFVNGHIHDEEKQNLAGFFLMFAILFGIFNGMGFVALHEIGPPGGAVTEMSEMSEANVKQGSEDSLEGASITGSETRHLISEPVPRIIKEGSEPSSSDIKVNDQISWKEKFKNSLLILLNNFKQLDFNLLLWAFFITTSIGLMFYNNITVILKSLNLENYATVFTILMPGIGLPVRLLFGILADCCLERIPRITYICVGSILMTISCLMCIFAIQNLAVLYLSTCFIGVQTALFWGLMPAIVCDKFGAKQIGCNWGLFALGSGLLAIAIQKIFGAFYDMHVVSQHAGGKTCYGSDCFRSTFIIVAICSSVALVFSIILLIRKCGNHSPN